MTDRDRIRRTDAVARTVALSLVLCMPCVAVAEPPRLLLQITVDQLRGDLPARHFEQFGEGGFRWLYEHGVVFSNAHHAHANTETIVGHTTLSTGAHPSTHGMVGNLWTDRRSGVTTYNVEDPAYRLLTSGADVSDDTEIDPTQRAARSEGRSPAAILVNTLADELRLATRGEAKAIGISVKDRGAIAMAGHTGTAYWFSKASGEFVTSSYYRQRYPEWVSRFNATAPTKRYSGQSWSLGREAGDYLFGQRDDQPWETDVAGFGRTFPHPYGDADSPYFTTLLTLSPAGDELVLDFAREAIASEALGQDGVTDYLSLSFSSTDYVGHVFGPSSLEAEENLLRLDRNLAALLAFVDETVGLEHTLIVLSADHGGPEAPGVLQALNIPAGLINPQDWETAPAVAAVRERFAIDGRLIGNYTAPYLYLSEEARRAAARDGDVEQALAEAMMTLPGVAVAVPRGALQNGQVPDSALHRAVAHNFHPERSGDVYLVFASNYFINDFDGLVVASSHGSPWRYDSFVPLVFAGWTLEKGRVSRQVHTVDVAPTLATLLGISAPSGAVGLPLPEVIQAN
jgi:hypothetical protein